MTDENEHKDALIAPWRSEKPVPRRKFLLWAGVAAVAAACRDAITDPVAAYDRINSRANRSSTLRDEKFADYPAPSYIPPGYTLVMEQDDRPDGFRFAMEDAFPYPFTQIGSVYRGPRAATTIVPSGMRYPLTIFATKRLDGTFVGTETAKAVQIPLTLSDGTKVTACISMVCGN